MHLAFGPPQTRGLICWEGQNLQGTPAWRSSFWESFEVQFQRRAMVLSALEKFQAEVLQRAEPRQRYGHVPGQLCGPRPTSLLTWRAQLLHL